VTELNKQSPQKAASLMTSKNHRIKSIGGTFALASTLTYATLTTLSALKVIPQSGNFIFLIAATLIATGATSLQEIRRQLNTGALSNIQIYASLVAIIIPLACLIQILTTQDLVDRNGRSSHTYILLESFLNLPWLIIGSKLPNSNYRTKNYIGIIFISVLLFLIIKNTDSAYIIDYTQLNKDSAPGTESTHLPLGSWGALLVIFSYTIVSRKIKYLALPTSLFIFYSMGGRGSLACFAASVIIYEAIFKNDAKLLIFMATISSAAILYLISSAEIINSSTLLNRMIFSSGLDEDGSLIERVDQFDRGLTLLLDQALYGNTSLIVQEFGTVGAYMHNILSAWQFFGAPVFFIITLLLISISLKLHKNRLQLTTPAQNFCLMLFIYSLTCVLTTKFVFFPLLWISVGACAFSIFQKPHAKVHKDDSRSFVQQAKNP
jgi:hypothetical protein